MAGSNEFTIIASYELRTISTNCWICYSSE